MRNNHQFSEICDKVKISKLVMLQYLFYNITFMEDVMRIEKTLVIIKPDAVKRKLIGKIVSVYEEKGLSIDKMALLMAEDSKLEQHYRIHAEKSFYPQLMAFMKSGPMVVLSVSGENAIDLVRRLNGATNPCESEVGSIRGRFAISATFNCVHGSDSFENAENEHRIWFG